MLLPNKLTPIFMSFYACRSPTEIIYYCLHEHECGGGYILDHGKLNSSYTTGKKMNISQ